MSLIYWSVIIVHTTHLYFHHSLFMFLCCFFFLPLLLFFLLVTFGFFSNFCCFCSTIQQQLTWFIRLTLVITKIKENKKNWNEKGFFLTIMRNKRKKNKNIIKMAQKLNFCMNEYLWYDILVLCEPIKRNDFYLLFLFNKIFDYIQKKWSFSLFWGYLWEIDKILIRIVWLFFSLWINWRTFWKSEPKIFVCNHLPLILNCHLMWKFIIWIHTWVLFRYLVKYIELVFVNGFDPFGLWWDNINEIFFLDLIWLKNVLKNVHCVWMILIRDVFTRALYIHVCIILTLRVIEFYYNNLIWN